MGKLPSVFGNLSNSCYVPFEKDVREWVTTWILYFLEERFYAGLSKVKSVLSLSGYPKICMRMSLD